MNQLNEIISEILEKKFRNRFTFLTGAGISADSGIPTYRSLDGIWIKGTKYHKPEEFGTYKYFIENQEEVWQHTLVLKNIKDNAKPNKSHHMLVEIERTLHNRFHLITQNIDNLHQKAGSKRIYEIHGNYREVKCSKNCKGIYPTPDVLRGKELTEDLTMEEIEALKCSECGSWMRPNVLWFDEYYDEKNHRIHSSLKLAKNTGILFVIGSSGATNLPIAIARQTLKYGGYVVDINIEDNHFTELLKNKKRGIIIRGKSNDTLQLIKNKLEENLNNL